MDNARAGSMVCGKTGFVVGLVRVDGDGDGHSNSNHGGEYDCMEMRKLWNHSNYEGHPYRGARV